MVYCYKAVIPESKTFTREYEIMPEMTLFDFNNFILNDLGFSPDQMVVFRGYNAKGQFCAEYGLFDFGNGSMDQVTFAKLIAKKQIELRYVYDMKYERYIRLLFQGETEDSRRFSYPRTTLEKGRTPDQFSKKYEDFEDFEEYKESTPDIDAESEPLDNQDN